MLYSIVKDPFISAADLNHDLDLIQKWAFQWKMEFNPDPLKQATEMIFSCKRKSQSTRHYILMGHRSPRSLNKNTLD